MLKMMLPVGSGLLVSLMFRAGKEHKKERQGTRTDIDRRLKEALADWRTRIALSCQAIRI